jgi:DnaJ-class molecular chaperone
MTTALAAARHVTTAGHTSPVTVTLFILAAIAGYALFLYFCPLRSCPRCHGTRITQAGRRTGMCRRCRGTGRIRRIGATAVHSFYWSVLGDRLREQRRDELARRRQPPDPPDL